MTNLGGLRWILMVYDGLRWFSGVSGKVILYITFEENYNHSYIRTYIHILYIYIYELYMNIPGGVLGSVAYHVVQMT
jgi:hypothetical protein